MSKTRLPQNASHRARLSSLSSLFPGSWSIRFIAPIVIVSSSFAYFCPQASGQNGARELSLRIDNAITSEIFDSSAHLSEAQLSELFSRTLSEVAEDYANEKAKYFAYENTMAGYDKAAKVLRATEKELDLLRVNVDKGVVSRKVGDTPDGKYIAAMSVDGKLYILHHPHDARNSVDLQNSIWTKEFRNGMTCDLFHHSSFLGGDVGFAGWVTIKKGQIQEISNQSGHYTPGSLAVAQLTHALRLQGATFSKDFRVLIEAGRGASNNRRNFPVKSSGGATGSCTSSLRVLFGS